MRLKNKAIWSNLNAVCEVGVKATILASLKIFRSSRLSLAFFEALAISAKLGGDVVSPVVALLPGGGLVFVSSDPRAGKMLRFLCNK